MNTSALFSTAYLAPIQYYSKFLIYGNIFIEKFEHYSKQSYRNRCTIMSANGLLNLSIPVKRESDIKVHTKDIRIDNDKRWASIHWRAIESAYRSSPFYIYYAEDLQAILNKKYEFLIDLNLELQDLLVSLLGVKANIQYTSDYKSVTAPFDDYSQSIHPKERFKIADNTFIQEPYYQVFEQKYGFKENLSIIDLLFNMGTSATEILQKSVIAK